MSDDDERSLRAPEAPHHPDCASLAGKGPWARCNCRPGMLDAPLGTVDLRSSEAPHTPEQIVDLLRQGAEIRAGIEDAYARVRRPAEAQPGCSHAPESRKANGICGACGLVVGELRSDDVPGVPWARLWLEVHVGTSSPAAERALDLLVDNVDGEDWAACAGAGSREFTPGPVEAPPHPFAKVRRLEASCGCVYTGDDVERCSACQLYVDAEMAKLRIEGNHCASCNAGDHAHCHMRCGCNCPEPRAETPCYDRRPASAQGLIPFDAMCALDRLFHQAIGRHLAGREESLTRADRDLVERALDGQRRASAQGPVAQRLVELTRLVSERDDEVERLFAVVRKLRQRRRLESAPACPFCAPGADPWNDPYSPVAKAVADGVRAERERIGAALRSYWFVAVSNYDVEQCLARVGAEELEPLRTGSAKKGGESDG